jgi:hypothetical protein
MMLSPKEVHQSPNSIIVRQLFRDLDHSMFLGCAGRV